MKILITGGAGFLGTQLARAILARGSLRGERITALTLSDIAGTLAPDLAGNPLVRFVRGNLSHRLQATQRGLSVAQHVATDQGTDSRRQVGQRTTEHPRLLFAAFAEAVVIRSAERRLSVADQVDRAHRRAPRAIVRRQRQCR